MKRIGFVSFLIILNLGLFGCPARNNTVTGTTNNPIVTQTSGGSSGGYIQPTPTQVGQSVTANCSGDPSADSDGSRTIPPHQFYVLMGGAHAPPNTAIPSTFLANDPVCTSWIPNAGGKCSGPDLNIIDSSNNSPWVFNLLQNDGPIYVRVRIEAQPLPGANTKLCPGRIPTSYNANTGVATYRNYDYPYTILSFRLRSKIMQKDPATNKVNILSGAVNEYGPYRILANACSPVIKISPPGASNPNTAMAFEIYDVRQNSECFQYYAQPWLYNAQDFQRMCVDLILVNNRNCFSMKVDVVTNNTSMFKGAPRN